MKKLILALAAVALLGTAAQAQKINKEALLQKIEKNETASADAKKGAKAATWLNLGKSYVEAILAPTKDLYVGELGLQLDMTFGSPKSIDEVTINGMSVAAQNYDYLTVYVSNGGLRTRFQAGSESQGAAYGDQQLLFAIGRCLQ